jgi:hypothetical protein
MVACLASQSVHGGSSRQSAGHCGTLQWLRTSDAEQQWEVVQVAAKAAECANMPMLQWVLEQQPEWTAESFKGMGEGAARAADAIDKMEWLFQRFPAYRSKLCYPFAVATIRCGAVESLKWLSLMEYPFIFDDYATYASEAGHLAALRYLLEEAGCPWDVAEVRKAAAEADSVEMLQWASTADDAVWTTAQLSELLEVAGQIDSLRAAVWLRAAGAEWPTSFLDQDPIHSRLGVLPLRTMQWARANGCSWGSWDSKLCTMICSLGQEGVWLNQQATRDAMLWAHAAGCPCDSWRHRLACILLHKESSGSSGSNDDNHSEVYADVGGNVATESGWNAALFRLCYTESTRGYASDD